MHVKSLQLTVLVCFAAVSASPAVASSCVGTFERPAYMSRGHFCSPGQLIEDAYEPGRKIPCEHVEVDHLISLRQAWQSGVCDNDLKRLANDPRNLRLTYWRTNRQKGYLPPDEFARNLPEPVAQKVIEDSRVLMRDYGIKTREQAVSTRMLAYATGQSGHVKVPVSGIGPAVSKSMTRSRIGKKVVVYVGRRAVGYVAVGAVAIDVILVSAWAVDWLTSPSQDERMRQRAVYFETILRGEE